MRETESLEREKASWLGETVSWCREMEAGGKETGSRRRATDAWSGETRSWTGEMKARGEEMKARGAIHDFVREWDDAVHKLVR